MSLTDAVPVRFSQETKARLEALSGRSGVPVAQLVRIATESYLDKVEATGKIEIDVSIPQNNNDDSSSSPPSLRPVGEVASELGKRAVVISQPKPLIGAPNARKLRQAKGAHASPSHQPKPPTRAPK